MKWVGDYVVTVNAGSSSIKLDIFRTGSEDKDNKHHRSALISGINESNASMTTWSGGENAQTVELDTTNISSAISTMTSWLREFSEHHKIVAISHRIVHGGPRHIKPELITSALLDDLTKYVIFDPEHLQVALELIQVMQGQFPDALEVACFDTEFFESMPINAKLLTLPRKYQADGLRRYGFRGLSYTYLLAEFRKIAGDDTANGRVIMAHLGTGASLAAVYQGKPVDTTMGFTPASGIMMSSRSGDVDPGIARYLQAEYGLGLAEYNRMVNFESGLLGVSGISADMHTLLQNEHSNQNAAEAVNLFVYQVKKAIGSLATTIGGVDSLIFSGGIGEKSDILRQRICSGLEYLGIELDSTQNQQHSECISSASSRVGVHVVPTFEAAVLMRSAMQVVNAVEDK